MIREIAVRIENEPGRMHAVAAALGDAGIDITALSVSDAEDSGVLRLIVPDLAGARRALMALDLPATVGDVVAVTARDEPGGLAAVLAPLHAEGIDIRYLYAFRRAAPARREIGDAVVVLHSDRDADAAAVLRRAGFTLLDEEALHG